MTGALSGGCWAGRPFGIFRTALGALFVSCHWVEYALTAHTFVFTCLFPCTHVCEHTHGMSAACCVVYVWCVGSVCLCGAHGVCTHMCGGCGFVGCPRMHSVRSYMALCMGGVVHMPLCLCMHAVCVCACGACRGCAWVGAVGTDGLTGSFSG